MRIGVPSGDPAPRAGRGPRRGAAFSGVFGWTRPGSLKARWLGTMCRVMGALWRNPRRVDGAQHAHQHRQRAHGLKAVGMRGQPAHGMEGHRSPVVVDAVFPGVGPRGSAVRKPVQARRGRSRAGQLADARGRDAGDAWRPTRGVHRPRVRAATERRRHARAVGQRSGLERRMRPSAMPSG